MKQFGVCALVLWIAAVLQQALPDRMAILGARPDLMLVAVLTLGLLIPAPGSIAVGFFGGLIQGALVGANLAQYVLTRMVTGYVASRLTELEIELSAPMAGLFVALGTLLAQIIMMFLAPPRSLGGFIGDTIETAIYNAVIAIPLYAVMRPILKSSRS